MVLAGLADPDPVVIFEHQYLCPSEGELDDAAPVADVWHAPVRRRGRDLSLISYGGALAKTLSAADELARAGIEAEVLDLRVLRPLDASSVVETIKRTHRAVIVDEGWKTGRAAPDADARACARRQAHGSPWCARAPPGGGRDAGLHHRDLYGQDGPPGL